MIIANFDFQDFLAELARSSESYSYASSFGNFFRLVFSILTIIGLWNMFNKAGEPGWGAIIPYYNTYLLYKIADMKKMFWLFLITSVTTVVLFFVFIFAIIASLVSVSTYNSNGIYGLVGSFMGFLIVFCAAMVIGLVLKIMNAIKIAQVFNLSGGYAVGIIFLPWLFYMIIGLSKEIHYKNRITSPQGFYGQGGYYQNPGMQNPYQQPYQQNVYQQNMYQQQPYQQNPYQQPNQQTTYQQNNYQQNVYDQNNATQAPYGQAPYGQAPYSQTAEAQQAYDAQQSPYMNPSKEEVWKNIYDENSNNIDQ